MEIFGRGKATTTYHSSPMHCVLRAPRLHVSNIGTHTYKCAHATSRSVCCGQRRRSRKISSNACLCGVCTLRSLQCMSVYQYVLAGEKVTKIIFCCVSINFHTVSVSFLWYFFSHILIWKREFFLWKIASYSSCSEWDDRQVPICTKIIEKNCWISSVVFVVCASRR